MVPCFGPDEELLGVLDIDPNQPAFFTNQDAYNLDQLMRKLFMGVMKYLDKLFYCFVF